MRRFDCCRVVLLTSIVWFTLDVFLLLYFLDCNRNPISSIGPEKLRIDNNHRFDENRIVNAPAVGDFKTKYVSNSETTFKTRRTETGPEDGILGKLMRGLNFNSGGPGEMGRGVHVDKKDEAHMKEKFKENQFNVMASDQISLNRTLPDVRMSQCRSKTYPDNLPATSVIIVFHNEAWSTLLRSLHSVINRSPKDLLKEIVLVDDFSDREYLRGPLEAYLRKLPVPCKLIHMPERSGLIRARLRGAEVALGPVLTFLDAHIEVINGWLEPLLARIKESKSNVVAPIIDVISDDTFEYVTASDMTWGGFNWHMNFRWYTVPKRELDRRKGDRAEPIRTPTIAGGLFAIDKDYFYEIGAYDEGMLIWGGENLEISFRVWQCGGQLEIVTCSHVGHVFRKQTPYTFPGGTAYIIHHNAARTVEVWMDNYKEFFYKMTPGARNVEVGNLTGRREFRNRLKCKSFQWYLKNIYPEAVIPLDYYSLGYIKSPDNNNCLDTMGKKSGANVGMSRCHSMGGNQAWSYTDLGEIRSDEICLESGGSHGQARLQTCHKAQGNQLWNYDPTTKHLRHVSSSQCLTSEGDNGSLKACRDDDPKQMWILEGYNPAGHSFANDTRNAGS